MSFIAAIILMVIDDDETIAWMVFTKILSVTSDWRRMYGENTPKLFEITKILRGFIRQELPKMH